MSPNNVTPIAIIGIAAELPSGSWSKSNLDYLSFYKFLLESGEAYEKIPLQRFNIHMLTGKSLGQVITDTGTFLKDLDQFDPVEFGITSKDAKLMNLGTRKLIETTFLALLDSGIDYRGRNVGCYMSAVAHDVFSVSGHDDAEARGAFSYLPAMVANRVSYHLDLRGPTVPIDTACSSSLYATHFAVQALRNGDCESAVVGGCQLNHRFSDWLIYTQGGILSPDGKCKPFDASANGFGRGEAVVSIVLKPLDAALRDRDNVYATILGTGINSSGSLAPVNAPVASAQQDAMVRAFKQAQRYRKEVDFVELHATGTATGDPTEANWVGVEFKRERDDELIVGSVKGNLGHTEITAFLTSLCKVCHIIEHGVIPPTVNMTVRNPAIRWEEHNMRAPIACEKLKIRSPSGNALIAMSSSGIGGANGHCVVEAHPSNIGGVQRMWSCESPKVPSLLLACGLSPRSAIAVGESLKSLPADTDRKRVGRTLGRRARSLLWKSFSVLSDGSDGKAPRFSEPVLMPKTAPEVVFVFSGQGPQHWDMGRGLFKTCVPFHDSVVELDRVYTESTGKSLIAEFGLFADTDVPDNLGDVWPISITLPALAVLQLALVDALAALGVKPDVAMGHSAGEMAVMYASGAASKAMALELAIARGQAMELMESHDGTMAAVACSADRAKEIIAEVIAQLGPAILEVGCYNSPDAVTLSGATKHITAAVQRAKAAGILATRLRTTVPVHSSMMSHCQADYQARVEKVFKKYDVGPTKIEVYSALNGDLLSGPYDAHYFWDNTYGPVLFDPAVKAIRARHPQAIFVELGPHPVLSGYITSITGQGSTVLCPLRRAKTAEINELTLFLDFLGRLVCTGYPGVDMDVLYGTAESAGADVPPYPFAKKEVSYVAPTFEISRQRQVRNGPLNYPQLRINTHTHLGLADHVIKNEPIMPAAGFLEMALEFGAKRLWDVEFHSMLSLSSERPTPVDVKLDGSRWSVCSANAADFTKTWPPTYGRVHATGYLSMDSELAAPPPLVPVEDIRARLKKWDMKNFYSHLDSFANYGPTYRRVLECYQGLDTNGNEELLIEIRGTGDDLDNVSDYRLHPAILDSALHFAVHPLLTGAIDHGRYYLPSKVGTLIAHDALESGIPERVYAYGIFVKWTPDMLTYNFTLTNEVGVPLCTIESLEVAAHGRTPLTVQNRYEMVQHTLDINVIFPEESEAGGMRKVVVAGSLKDFERKIRIFKYRRGRELDIQHVVRSLNPAEKELLCFGTSEGLDGDAILGFTRSLRKEYRSWKVFCVIFPASWLPEQHEEVARVLCAHPLAEEEMILDADGSVRASRVILSSAPKRITSFDSEAPWICQRSNVMQVSKPDVPSGHVFVHIMGLSPDVSSYRTFVGRVDGSTRLYAGIFSGPVSNHVVVHRGSLLELRDATLLKSGPDVLAAIVAVLPIGQARFDDPSRTEGSCILVTHSDTNLGRSVCRLYESRGLQVTRLPTQASTSEVRAALARRPKFIVSGRERITADDIDKTIHRLQQGRVIQWDDPDSGIARVLVEDPWAVGDALKLAFSKNSAEHRIPLTHPSHLLGDTKPTEVSSLATIFDPEKAYILVGGIGGLGLHIAYWMYKNGAREIILTSRSGTDNLVPKDEFIALRLLAYLRSLGNLVLRTEAVDASSVEQTKQLLNSVQKPLGGCMILTAVLIDRTFPMQTEETFEAPFKAKLGAFNALEQAIDIESLDFVLAYSSIVGLTGNAGQTNYSSANTALTGVTRKYRNAATILPPMISDTGFFLTMAATEPLRYSRYRHLSACAMTCEELCEGIGETLLKLREGPVWQYIPDFDWVQVQNHFGPTPLYDHLVYRNSSSDTDQNSAAELERSLRDIVCDVLDIDHQDLSLDVPLTSYGLDSLSAAALSHALEPYMTISQLQLLADVTLSDLEELRDGSSKVTTPDTASVQGVASVDASLDEPTKCKVQEMLSMLQKYSTGLPPRTVEGWATMSKAVLLTGATGSLGSHVAAHLLSDAPTHKIFAIVRPDATGKSAKDRLLDVFKARGLDTAFLSSQKLTVLDGDLLLPMFGLSSNSYNELLHSVTHIVHLAWPINFVAPLSALEPHIRGVRYMIDFAASSDAYVRIIFASTAGMFRRLPDRNPVPEVYVEDPSIAVGLGYPESKWVAERLITMAGERGIFSHTIVRVGQLSGGANGAWRTSEWLPSMVSASIALGCLPDASGYVSWLPVDDAAAALVDFIDCSEKVLHLCHPRPVMWPDVFKHFASVLNLPLIPYTDWVTRLEHGLVSSDDASAIRGLEHGLRLLDIFRLLVDPDEPRPDLMGKLVPHMDMTHALEVSTTLRNGFVSKIGLEDVRRWVEFWRREGFIPAVAAA